MKPIPFLTEEEIQKLQKAEASSSKEQKRTAEQIEAIYTAGQNILVSASAGSGKTFVMAERILDQLARGVEISQLFISTFTVKAATELKERLEKKISQQIQETVDVDLKQHLGRQLADLPNAAIGTMDSFTQKFLGKHGYLIDIAPNFRILQNESEQLLLKNEVFHQFFEDHYQGENKRALVDWTRTLLGVARMKEVCASKSTKFMISFNPLVILKNGLVTRSSKGLKKLILLVKKKN